MAKRLRGRRAVVQRRRRLAAEPLCRACMAKGFVTVAVTPDHIQPLALGGSDEETNIQALCEECHADKTRADFYAGGSDIQGWPTDPDHPWNTAP